MTVKWYKKNIIIWNIANDGKSSWLKWDTILTLQVPQFTPNHNIEHLNFKTFLEENAPGPPYMLMPYGHS